MVTLRLCERNRGAVTVCLATTTFDPEFSSEQDGAAIGGRLSGRGQLIRIMSVFKGVPIRFSENSGRRRKRGSSEVVGSHFDGSAAEVCVGSSRRFGCNIARSNSQLGAGANYLEFTTGNCLKWKPGELHMESRGASLARYASSQISVYELWCALWS